MPTIGAQRASSSSSPSPATWTSSSQAAQLSGPLLVGGKLDVSSAYTLTFDFNPKSIEVKHGVGVKDKKNGEGQDGQSGQASNIDKLGLPQLNLKETTFYGANTLTKCEQ